ncbi:peroxiredoxin [Rhodobacteraceae bacterium nBUS_24]
MSNLPYPAPDVQLPRDGGESLDLTEFRPAAVVLFFYPRDNTSGCTKEAQAFSTLQADFEEIGVYVVGISKDSVKSHNKFVEKQSLTIPLLSDENSNVSETFGVWKEKSMYGKTYFGIERSTFLINGQGEIVQEWRKVKVPGHAEDVLEAAKSILPKRQK